ncbi:MAG: hypothetical protein AMJ81_07310 [Phycisphaerae bacterium SM23_33]|nr:MAG: hypothetical protein AMJ81_07310 [Phycisphaerae bacterium SM23_33]
MGIWVAVTALAGCGTPSTEALVEQGITYFQVGRLDQAETTLKRALDQNPSDPDALFYMGRICDLKGLQERAMYYYQCCMDADPSYVAAQKHLLEAQRQLGPAGQALRFIPDLPQQD